MSMDYEHALNGPDPLDEEARSFELPDKSIIQVDHKDRYNATEILFQPELADIKSQGIHEMAFKSIEKCDQDLKISLYNNIILSGGTTLLPGFKERFEMEIKNLAMHTAKTDIEVFAE